MEMLGKIRRMFLRDKLSLHEITKRTGLSRNTIRRWLRAAAEKAPPTYRQVKGPGKLTEFHAALEPIRKTTRRMVIRTPRVSIPDGGGKES